MKFEKWISRIILRPKRTAPLPIFSFLAYRYQEHMYCDKIEIMILAREYCDVNFLPYCQTLDCWLSFYYSFHFCSI